MMKDPVCGAQVDEKTSSASSNYQGRRYAFCGNECKEKFDKNPERYATSKGQAHSQQQGHSQQHEKMTR